MKVDGYFSHLVYGTIVIRERTILFSVRVKSVRPSEVISRKISAIIISSYKALGM